MRTSAASLVPGERVLREEGVSKADIAAVLVADAVLVLLGEAFVIAISGPMRSYQAFVGSQSPISFDAVYAAMPSAFVLFAVVTIGWQLLVALSTRYTLTDRRLLTRRGIVARAMSQAELHRIQDVNVRQNFAGRILNYGHVYVETAGTSGVIVLKYVNDPAGWAHALYEQRQAAPVTVTSADSALSGNLPRRGYVAPHPPIAPGTH